jgi:ABC-type Fe3+-hydroxamate transport system substrate-binding protein
MRGPILLLAASLVLAAGAAGCGLKSEPTGAQPGYPLSVVDGAGRTVTLDAPPRRIVSLDAGLTESLFALGAGPLVVGRSGSELYPAAALRLPAELAAGTPDTARIQQLHPDLVLAAPGTTAAQASAMAAQLHAPVYVPDQTTVRGIEHDMLAVAGLVGRAGPGRSLIAGMRAQIGRVQRLIASRPDVSVFVDRGRRTTIGPDGLGALMLTLARGLNAAAGAAPGAPYPLARLRRSPPAVYLSVEASGAASRASLRRDRVRVRRFAVIGRGLLTDAGPRMPQALSTLAGLLHPGAALSSTHG